MTPKKERIQKYLAGLGIASRRAIEAWVIAGRITVNGRLAEVGQLVDAKNAIRIDGKPLAKQSLRTAPTQVLAYHKCAGEICTRHDPEGRVTVFRHLPPIKAGRWISVGRLDLNTSGLLLFTDNGALAHRLMHPSSGIDREYMVRVLGTVTPEMLSCLLEGVPLSEGMAKFDALRVAGGSGANRWYDVVVSQGKNRIVRRLWESQGVKVSRLHRIGYGCLALPKSLQEGKFVYLSEQEIAALVALGA